MTTGWENPNSNDPVVLDHLRRGRRAWWIQTLRSIAIVGLAALALWVAWSYLTGPTEVDVKIVTTTSK